MRNLLPALVVTVLGFSSAQAAPAKASPFSNKSFGDGGGYKHPDADVGQYFEVKPERPAEQPAQKQPPAPARPIKVTPDVPPIALIPSRPRPRPFAPAPVAMVKRELDPAAPAAEASLDSASEDARSDYESRLFGTAPRARRPDLAGGSNEPADPALSVPTGEGMLFVSLELDAQEAGSLRDAVAGLGAAAAFRPDPRFQPLPGEAGSVRISGWLPASRLGDAIARPGVRRVAVERGALPAADDRVTGDYLIKLRVTDAARPDQSVAMSLQDLSARTGFKVGHVLGYETVPGDGTVALVSGKMPVSQLSRALSLPGILHVGPAVLEMASAPAAPASARKDGFLKFVLARSLWLVLLTVLLALPTIGDAVKSGLSVFVPYR